MINQLTAEATVMKRGLHWRCITSAEAAEWADAWIAKLADPPAELLDLSLSGRFREAEAASVLERLRAQQPRSWCQRLSDCWRKS